jgi:hypothetical protein
VRRVELDKIASVTLRLGLAKNAILGDEIPAVEGTVIAARVLNAKTTYNTLEDVHGRMVTLYPGDVIAAALGHRDALYGYSGRVPAAVKPGDVLNVLNLGGVIGEGAEAAPGIGEPFRVEVLGAVLEFPYVGTRVGVPANVARVALPPLDLGDDLPPVIALVGTCMDAGKTTAACVIIGELARAGKRVASGKLTGVSLRRDVLQMKDCGAEPSLVFTDFGVVTTSEATAAETGKTLLAHLADSEPDVIVLELGDGLLGTYGVHALLDDVRFRGALTQIVLCAQDPVGAWGGQQILGERYGLHAAVICGRVTDTAAGQRFCRDRLETPAWNALKDGPQLVATLQDGIANATATGAPK